MSFRLLIIKPTMLNYSNLAPFNCTLKTLDMVFGTNFNCGRFSRWVRSNLSMGDCQMNPQDLNFSDRATMKSLDATLVPTT